MTRHSRRLEEQVADATGHLERTKSSTRKQADLVSGLKRGARRKQETRILDDMRSCQGSAELYVDGLRNQLDRYRC
jgi:hypothetical protein